jgi:DNA primase
MAGIPDSVIDDVRARTDIVSVVESYLPLKRRGSDYWGCCPFHNERTPSFKVSAQHNAFYCFGCKKHGDVFGFVMERENVDFIGAVRLLAQRVGVTIPEEDERTDAGGRSPRLTRDRLYELLKNAALWYRQLLTSAPEAAKARDYLAGRGIPDDVAAKFGLGYSPDSFDACAQWAQRLGYPSELLLDAGLLTKPEDRPRPYDRFRGRLMFPIWDETGRVVGFSARILEKDAKQAKYVNSPDGPLFHKGKLLYGLHFARQSFKELGTALVCEGQLDTIACHRAGMTNAVAPQGTAFTEDHARLLARFTKSVTFCFDADEAGENAALRSIETAILVGLEPKTVTLPFDQDPDSLYQAQGPDALAAALRNSQDALAFVLDLARRKHSPTSTEGRTRIVEMALPVIAKFASPVTRAGYCQWLASELRLPSESVLEALRQHLAAQQRGLRNAAARPGQPPIAQAAPIPMPAKPAELTPVQRAEAMLLDLALRDEPSARTLAARLSHDRVSDTPVGQALNHVIGMASQGDWEQAVHELLKDSVLGQDAEIARILFSGEFQPPEAGADDALRERYVRRVRKAMEDCLALIGLDTVRREHEQLQRALATEADPARIEEITLRIQELARQRKEIQTRA